MKRGAWLALPAILLAAGPALATEGRSELTTLFWTVFNLALLLGVLFVLGRERVLTWFNDRRDHIRAEIESAAKLRDEAQQQHARWQRQLDELDAELERIRTSARERAEHERERILADARAGAERIRNDARLAVEQEVRRARQQLRQEASDLSVTLAGELLRQQVTDADRDRLVDEFVATIERRAAQPES